MVYSFCISPQHPVLRRRVGGDEGTNCTLYKVDKDGKESRGRADSSNLRLVAIIYSEV